MLMDLAVANFFYQIPEPHDWYVRVASPPALQTYISVFNKYDVKTLVVSLISGQNTIESSFHLLKPCSSLSMNNFFRYFFSAGIERKQIHGYKVL